MNSSRSPKRTRNTVAVLAALLLSSVAANAVAQELAPPAPLQLPSAPIAAPAPPAPAGAAAAVRAGHDAQADVGTPAAADVGGAPAVPAGASLGEANERVKQMSSEADQLLDRLVDGALTNEASKSTVDDMHSSELRIMQLKDRLQEAKLVAEYWETVSGKDHRADEKIKALETEKTDMEAELKRLRDAAAKAATTTNRFAADPDPVVAEITGAAGSVKAKILIPYMGQIIARSGDTLPNGQKITEIGGNGVKVRRADGAVVTLGYGTSVPATRPPQPAGGGVSAVISQ